MGLSPRDILDTKNESNICLFSLAKYLNIYKIYKCVNWKSTYQSNYVCPSDRIKQHEQQRQQYAESWRERSADDNGQDYRRKECTGLRTVAYPTTEQKPRDQIYKGMSIIAAILIYPISV